MLLPDAAAALRESAANLVDELVKAQADSALHEASSLLAWAWVEQLRAEYEPKENHDARHIKACTIAKMLCQAEGGNPDEIVMRYAGSPYVCQTPRGTAPAIGVMLTQCCPLWVHYVPIAQSVMDALASQEAA